MYHPPQHFSHDIMINDICSLLFLRNPNLRSASKDCVRDNFPFLWARKMRVSQLGFRVDYTSYIDKFRNCSFAVRTSFSFIARIKVENIIDWLCSCRSPAKARARSVMVFALYTHHITLTLLSCFSAPCSEYMRTLFESTQSQESKSEVCTHDFFIEVPCGQIWEHVIAGAPAGLLYFLYLSI